MSRRQAGSKSAYKSFIKLDKWMSWLSEGQLESREKFRKRKTMRTCLWVEGWIALCNPWIVGARD